MPPDPPRMSHSFGARLHDHSHDAGFATGSDHMCYATNVMEQTCYATTKVMEQTRYATNVT
jgi:hypothetical protein